ncbi:MAG TPA: glycerophosphodiester phosphodiesterase [Candidatus Binataceae bacterium]|nr:glycerophosphodiester phosphodiesterase [Candidatus Binataceae bacterium]
MRAKLDTEFFEPGRPRVFAHRGASGDYPENTIEAFRAATERGAPYIELDVHMTRDGAIVVIHDDDLRRVSDRDSVVAETRLVKVQAADAGYNFSPDARSFPFRGRGLRVPTLEEVLSAFPQQRFIIEVKQITPSPIVPALEIIAQTRMSRRVLIASEHQAPLDDARQLAPQIPTNFSTAEVGDFFRSMAPDAAPYAPLGAALQIPPEHLSWKLVTPESVAAAHRLGVEVHVWTVNDAAEMRDMLALGVDGIITDYPGRLLELLRT